MSSWIVETLLRNRLLIKSEGDIESDTFNDVLVIEKKIKDLYGQGLLSNFEIEIIDFVSDGKPFTNSKELLGKDRTTISKDFSIICERIAYFLGGYFTNEGLIEDLTKRLNLNEEQIKRAREFIYKKG